jgi:hypothetical protein
MNPSTKFYPSRKPDNVVYASASFSGEVYRFDMFGMTQPKRELFGNVLQPDNQTGIEGPDGRLNYVVKAF